MNWRSGDFDREKVGGFYRRFTPAHAVESLHSVDLVKLWARGKRLLLLDVDHTLVQWRAESFSPEVLAWIAQAKELGFEICLISNTKRPERLERLRTMLDVHTVRGMFKPSRAMFRLALIKFKRKPDEALMIGDQMMTDILGANRAGIDAIWVRKMDGPEFKGTAINRAIEKWLTSAIYEALIAPIDEKPDAPDLEAAKPVGSKTIVHQLIKFLIVGGSSFVIDYGIRMVLIYHTSFGPAAGAAIRSGFPSVYGERTLTDAAFPVCATISGAAGILNSFIWNRSWTFQIKGKEERGSQLKRFIVVAVIGLVIAVIFGSIFSHILPGEGKSKTTMATILGAVVAAFWNFLGQRFFAFKPKGAK